MISLSLSLSQRLDLTAPTRLLGPRKILKSGPLAKSKSGRKLNCYLFNDLLLLTESRANNVESVYRYVRSTLLTLTSVRRTDGSPSHPYFDSPCPSKK